MPMPTAPNFAQLIASAHTTLARRTTAPSSAEPPVMDAAQLAARIDHTLLKPDATESQIRQLCAEAQQYGFAAVCVNPTWVALCAELLSGGPVKVCTVIGFPLGATLTEVKAFEAAQAARLGAHEVDMVLNIGRLKAGQWADVHADIAAVAEAAHAGAALLKVIIETALLTDDEKVAACVLAQYAHADFVKTSTGFGGGGATVGDVRLMRTVVGEEMGVKASGGIRTAADALALVAAGATRIGASAGVSIVHALAEGQLSNPATGIKDSY